MTNQPMINPIDLSNRTALVTGASRGIGRAIALILARAGADIAVNYSTRRAEAEEVAHQITALGRRAMPIAADVSDSAAVATTVAAITGTLGPIDLLVNNAGIGPPHGLDDLTEAVFDRTIAVNLKSAFLCIQAVLPAMRARRFGRIVNISSGAARGAGGIGVHYNASKAGLEGLTRGYAARLAAEGITVNAIAPSLIDTEMVAPIRAAAARIPVGRLGTAEEVAQAVLLAMGNAYMTGQTIQLNGGLSFI
ncbi:MAG TPA: SDR family NAD(P)-dependent oxidoreductase [Acetobacteraceae bacterium]|jgi:3-oxoacyl-[acyl-carrier protein] reductase|nr:SDR family NAD(P)-dependent oxidoreductase [Acetobacteraceae bacterium]